MSEELTGMRWAGRVTAGDIEEQDPSRQLFDAEVFHEFEREPIEFADGEKMRDAGNVMVRFSDLEENAYRMHLTEEQALRLAFLLQRVVGWIEDERSDAPDTERQLERLRAENGAA